MMNITGYTFHGFLQPSKENKDKFKKEREEISKIGQKMLAKFDSLHESSDGIGKMYKMQEFDMYIFEHNPLTGLFIAKTTGDLGDSGLVGILSQDNSIMLRQLTIAKSIYHYEGRMTLEAPLVFEGQYKIPSKSTRLWGNWSMQQIK